MRRSPSVASASANCECRRHYVPWQSTTWASTCAEREIDPVRSDILDSGAAECAAGLFCRVISAERVPGWLP